MAEPAIRIDGLTKVYRGSRGAITAVEDLSLSIDSGRIFGLLGPNGAGKTTTVRMICGLIRPTAGSIHVDGLSVRDQPDAVRARIGLVPEDAGDYRNLTLNEALEFYGALHGISAADVRITCRPLIERLGLADRADSRLGTYSRGMRRKAQLLRALVHQPRLLLLDEPTAGLDPSIVEEVWCMMHSLVAEQHVTIVICSHHLEEIERLCSRVAIIQRRLLVEGSLAELSGGQRRFRVRVRADAAILAAAVSSVEGVAAAHVQDSSIYFEVAGPAEEVVPRVVEKIVRAGGAVMELAPHGRDLRDLYRSFVGSGNGGEEMAAALPGGAGGGTKSPVSLGGSR